jgi:hypothetical protein
MLASAPPSSLKKTSNVKNRLPAKYFRRGQVEVGGTKWG